MKIVTFYDHVKDISEQENITMHEALCLVKEMGVSHLEVSDNNLLGREKELKDELDRAGLEISSICSYFDFGREPEIGEKAFSILEAASLFNVKYILVIPGFFAENDTEEEKETQTCNMISAVNKLKEETDKRGITLMLEDYDNMIAPYATIEGVERFMQGVPGLVCAFDTGNFLYSDQDEIEAFEKLKDRIGYMHLKDRTLTKPEVCGQEVISMAGRKLYSSAVGSGVVKMDEIVDNLKADGYDGVYTIELYGNAQTYVDMRKSVKWLKEKGIC
jgi:Sugar phosphate isomerases/epimerases